MIKVALSVAIPTYNGVKTLNETLQSVIRELRSLERDDVNIEIFDNGSTGESRDFLDQLRLPEGSLVHRSALNLGYDENMRRSVEGSAGAYVKVLADDDVLNAGTLKRLLKIIESDDTLAFVVSDFQKVSTDMKVVLEPPIVDYTSDGRHEGESSLGLCRGRFGQVSSLTFKRSLFSQLDFTSAQGSSYLHVYATYALAAKHPYYINAGAQLNVRDGSPNFSASARQMIETAVFGLRAVQFLSDMGFSRGFVSRTYGEHAQYLSRLFLFAKKEGVVGLLPLVADSIKVLGPRPLLLFAGCLTLAPRVLVASLYMLVRNVVKARP